MVVSCQLHALAALPSWVMNAQRSSNRRLGVSQRVSREFVTDQAQFPRIQLIVYTVTVPREAPCLDRSIQIRLCYEIRYLWKWFNVFQFQASVNAVGSLVVPENLRNFWLAERLHNFKEEASNTLRLLNRHHNDCNRSSTYFYICRLFNFDASTGVINLLQS